MSDERNAELETRIVAAIEGDGPLRASQIIDRLKCHHCGLAPIQDIRDILRSGDQLALDGELRWYVRPDKEAS